MMLLPKECNLKPEEVIGKNDFDLWPQRLAEKYRIDDQKVIKSRRRFLSKKSIDKVAANGGTFKTLFLMTEARLLGLPAFLGIYPNVESTRAP